MVKIDATNWQEYEGDAAYRCAGCGKDVRRKAPAYVSENNSSGAYLKARLVMGLLQCPVCQKRQSRERRRRTA